MPEPTKGETREHFIGRCIRYLRREGTTHAKSKGVSEGEAIAGKCYGLWRNAHPEDKK